jgi:hypothetical protein
MATPFKANEQIPFEDLTLQGVIFSVQNFGHSRSGADGTKGKRQYAIGFEFPSWVDQDSKPHTLWVITSASTYPTCTLATILKTLGWKVNVGDEVDPNALVGENMGVKIRLGGKSSSYQPGDIVGFCELPSDAKKVTPLNPVNTPVPLSLVEHMAGFKWAGNKNTPMNQPKQATGNSHKP